MANKQKSSKASSRPTLWLSRDQMAQLFGVAANSFDQGARKVLPAAGPHIRQERKRGPVLFNAHAYISAWYEAGVAKAVDAAGGDDMLTGDASPALEKYRAIRAAMAELDLKERQLSLLPREDVHTGLLRIFLPIRNATDQLRRRYGNDAGTIMDEAADDAQRGITELFGPEAP